MSKNKARKDRQKQNKNKGNKKQSQEDEEVPMKPPKQVRQPKKKKGSQPVQVPTKPSPKQQQQQKQQQPNKKQQTQKKQPAPTNSENPLLQAHQEFMASQCTPEERDTFFSNDLLDADRRAELWMEQADRGETLVNEFSWAIPDERAMRILHHFSPIVEIGCGANAYWAKQMSAAGVDVVAYDMHPEEGGKIMDDDESSSQKDKKRKRNKSSQGGETSLQVHQGGPEVLASKKLRNAKRALFLCYSDEEAIQSTPPENGESDDSSDEEEEDEDDGQPEMPGGMTSLGTECLKHYTGDYIIHVGELYGDTISMDQAPWGRSSGAEFQQELSATFHCLLRVSLPNWIHVKDTLSVWKRSERCSIVFAADSDEEEEEDEEVEYKHIPVTERLPTDLAAPCLSHLLGPCNGDSASSSAAKPKSKQKEKKAQEAPLPSSDDDNSDSESDGPEVNQVSKKQRKGKAKEASSSSDDDDKEEEEDYEVQW